ncbi:MAG: glycosyltransferase family 1 protein [Patescibacteria group bacterium]|nr:glycosyltransferase family 1 protein [Patescibacteria group bacterium]MDD4610836.1 glycosyltransferase family 1 protein [Patescibacteria group bacterium]
MLIGIDASRANRDKKTGTEYYSYYLIRNLAKIDSKNQYILYTDKPLQGGLLDLTTSDSEVVINDDEIKFDKNGYQIIKSPHNNFRAKVLKWPFSFFWTLGRLSLEMILHKPDILFVPAHGLPLAMPKNTIATIHDVAFARDEFVYEDDRMGADSNFGKKIINRLVRIFTLGKYGANSRDYLRWSTRFALSRAKKIITISNYSKEEIIKFYNVQKDKIKVIYNGFNNLLCSRRNNLEQVTEQLKKYGITQPYILYVGRIEKKKNIPALIEACALALEKDKDIKEKLVLIGKASFGYDDVNFNIQEFGLNDRVIIPGWIEETDLSILYQGATAFIFPSKHEGFGIPILEAMACGTPVIASDIPVIKEIAGEDAYYFDANIPLSIAEAIIRIINDDQLRQRLIEKGKTRVKNFSWKKCAEETLREINNL